MDRDDEGRRPESPSRENGAGTTNGTSNEHRSAPRLLAPRPPTWRGRHTTEDEELLNRNVPSLPRSKAPELGAFTHTDPWRVLRIQGEFVHGMNALAEVGAAIAVFGSARFGPDTPHYADAC